VVWPKVSIIWVNYNSMGIKDVILKSLDSIASLDYPSDRYELIVVDNSSSDGSDILVEEFLSGKSGLRWRIMRLNRNLGYAGGVNEGFKVRDRDSKYVVAMNNDAIPAQNSLKDFVEIMESYPRVGAAQGILLRDRNTIDTAGDFASEILTPHILLHGKPVELAPLKKIFVVSYADGAYVMYRVEALKDAYRAELVYPIGGHTYFDDGITGFLLWNAGWWSISTGRISGFHDRSSTYRRVRPLQLYLSVRGSLATTSLAQNHRLKPLRYVFHVRSFLSPRALKNATLMRSMIEGVAGGLRLGRFLRLKGLTVDLSKVPLIPLDPIDSLRALSCRKCFEVYMDEVIYKKYLPRLLIDKIR